MIRFGEISKILVNNPQTIIANGKHPYLGSPVSYLGAYEHNGYIFFDVEGRQANAHAYVPLKSSTPRQRQVMELRGPDDVVLTLYERGHKGTKPVSNPALHEGNLKRDLLRLRDIFERKNNY